MLKILNNIVLLIIKVKYILFDVDNQCVWYFMFWSEMKLAEHPCRNILFHSVGNIKSEFLIF